MKNSTKKIAAWTRKSGTNDQLVSTYFNAKTISGAKTEAKERGLEIDGKPYVVK